MGKQYVFFDCETHNAGLEYGMEPEQFVRLFQYAINDGPVKMITDLAQAKQILRDADFIVGHNIINADLNWMFGVDSMEPLQMSLDQKVIDTYVLANLVTPAPYMYTDRTGHTFYDASKPERAMRWLSLANLCHQFGLPGKMGDLSEIAKRYNPGKTAKRDLQYGVIPLDDAEFLEYAEQDIVAVRGLYYHLLAELKKQDYPGDYVWREMVKWALNAQITKNGVTVDVAEAERRVAELAEERDRIMAWLVEKYDFPTAGKQPWKSSAGKEAILAALKDYGITPDSVLWDETTSGAPSFSGDTMVAVTEGTEAEEFGRALATLQGQRSLAQLALESVHEDGKAHPSILCLQRSSRTSVTRPGLTVWTARGPGAVEKRYFVPDPGHKMVSMDYSAADARAVAAVSGDPEFAKRFEPGVDSHDLTGEIFFGSEEYYADRDRLRPIAKMGGHALAYRIGARKLASSVGVDIQTATRFIENYKKAYPFVARWQDDITAFAEEHGYVVNSWGRRMPVDDGRAFNQASSLIGQSTTTEVLYDGLISIARDNIEVIRWVRMPVHDEIVLSIPETDLSWGIDYVVSNMSTTFNPNTPVSRPIEFYISAGQPADNWHLATHE